jgi:urease accessory protein
MLIASKLIPGGGGLAAALLRRAATLELDWDTRQKSRFDGVDSNERRVAAFLPRGTVARGGDVLVAEDGSLIVVRAKVQPVLVVSAGSLSLPHDLLRAAYHLGNRHVPLEVVPDRLQLEPDHVLAAMLRRIGLNVDEAIAAFEPEAGAYGSASASGAHRHADADPASRPHQHDHGHGDLDGRNGSERR